MAPRDAWGDDTGEDTERLDLGFAEDWPVRQLRASRDPRPTEEIPVLVAPERAARTHRGALLATAAVGAVAVAAAVGFGVHDLSETGPAPAGTTTTVTVTATPTDQPTDQPTAEPTAEPTDQPTVTGPGGDGPAAGGGPGAGRGPGGGMGAGPAGPAA